MPVIDDLYDAIRARECVLFLGAGVHYPPSQDSAYRYPEPQRPPLGGALSEAFATRGLSDIKNDAANDVLNTTGLAPQARKLREAEWEIAEDKRKRRAKYLETHRGNLQRTSWYHEVHRSRGSLEQTVVEAVGPTKQPSPIVRALAELDFPIVMTTNYDQLYERALGPARAPKICVYDPLGREPTKRFPGLPKPGERWLFKMHGCISDPKSIVITDEDYINFVMRMGDPEDYNPVPQKIRVQFQEWPTLFVGYSLLDYNLRLLFRTLRRRLDKGERPPTFSLDPSPDLLVVATYGAALGAGADGPLISFIEQDSWRFVPELYQRILGRPMPA